MNEPLVKFTIELCPIEGAKLGDNETVEMTCFMDGQQVVPNDGIAVKFCCAACALEAQAGSLYALAQHLRARSRAADNDPSEAWKKGDQ